ncbi:MAG: MraY family glycosyltransferase [Methyloligellaceae bacterium]
MILAFSFIGALFVTMVLVPPLMRLAAPLHLLDVPDERKIHTELVPRCGGLAIACGIALPLLMWLPKDAPILSLLAGALVVFLFGLWDDVRDLNYKVKLIGQILALIIVMKGGIVLVHLPFTGLDPAPLWLSYPATALFIIGITNAVNLSDGLDGLAAGCTLLTLAMIAFLAYQANGFPALLLALTVMGGILGFLRYNTFPAIVFLGDAGSQFLGFIAATLTIYLVERLNTALSPALPLLLLGLPIFDTVWVMALRLRRGRSPFHPDRNHIHHQFLGLGLKHYEAVSLIYALHGILICAAYYLRYQSDILIISGYLVFCLAVAGAIKYAISLGWRLHPPSPDSGGFVERRNLWLRRRTWLPAFTTQYLAFSVAVFLVAGALLVVHVPRDFVVVSVAAIVVVSAGSLFLKGYLRLLTRAGVYMSSVLLVFLFAEIPTEGWIDDFSINLYLVVSSVVLVLGIRVTRRDLFRVTPQDLLIVFFALVVPNLTSQYLVQYPIGEIVFRLLVLFYITEFLLNKEQIASGIEDGSVKITDFINKLLRFSALLCLLILVLKGQYWW